MKKSILFSMGLVLLLMLMLAENAAATNILPELLANSRKIATLNHIVEHDGQIYASGFLCKPEWNPVPGVNIYTGGFAVVGDALIYKRPQGTGAFPTELYRSDLRGGGETVITDDADSYGGVWVVENRVVYASMTETPDYEYVCTGVFWYDVNASKSTRLLKDLSSDETFSLLSFDDEFVYYRLSPTGGVRRIRWDGSGDEALKSRGENFPRDETLGGMEFPVGLYKVEDRFYYCFNIETSIVSRYRYVASGEYSSGSCGIGFDTSLLAMKDGFAYYGNQSGVYKWEMDMGEEFKHARLAPLAPGVQGMSFGEGIIVGDDLYFSAHYDGGEDAANTRLYKVPLNGGQMEYQNVEWFQS